MPGVWRNNSTGPAGERGSVTTAEMDEAIAEAGHAVANGDRADVMRIARALLALDCEVTDLTATRDTARAECERLRAGLVELREAWAAQPDDIREYNGVRRDSIRLLKAIAAIAEVPQ